MLKPNKKFSQKLPTALKICGQVFLSLLICTVLVGSFSLIADISLNREYEASEGLGNTVRDFSLANFPLTIDVEEVAEIMLQTKPDVPTGNLHPVFRSDTPEIIEVDNNGMVRGIRPGTGSILARVGNIVKYFPVTVTDHIYSFRFKTDGENYDSEKKCLNLTYPDTLFLDFDCTPASMKNYANLTWEVDDLSIATVEDGVLTPINGGDVLVTASYGDIKDSIRVHIDVPLTDMYFTTEGLTINFGDTLTLPLSYAPQNATDIPKPTYESSNPAAVKVDSQGRITGNGAGRALITAKYKDFTATALITAVIPITGVQISQPEIYINKNESARLSASVIPSNTTEEKSIYWSSNNIQVATVENGLVRGISAGTCTITAYHGDFYATTTVHILSPMQSISFEQGTLSLIETFSAPLTVNFQPLDTTESRDINWYTSDLSVATVTNGVVTAKKAGNCEIYAQSAVHPNISATAKITVTPYIYVSSVTLDIHQISFNAFGETKKLNVTVAPSNAIDKSVAFQSSNSSVATVDSSGIVRAVGSGSCTIYATSGGKQDSCVVTVAAPNIVIFLDPGHDASHTGAYYSNVYEHKINLMVAKSCQEYLMSHYAGITVQLTHDTESCPNGSSTAMCLETRVQLAQNAGASYLISMHFNASANHNASGSVAYVSHIPGIAEPSQALAESILSVISANTGLLNRHCESWNSTDYFDSFGNPLDYHAICRHAANRGFPGIIIEHCFMDCDTSFITNEQAVKNFGIYDAIGIANYLGLQPK